MLQKGNNYVYYWCLFVGIFACSHNFEWFTGVYGRNWIGNRKNGKARSGSPHPARQHVAHGVIRYEGGSQQIQSHRWAGSRRAPLSLSAPFPKKCNDIIKYIYFNAASTRGVCDINNEGSLNQNGFFVEKFCPSWACKYTKVLSP